MNRKFLFSFFLMLSILAVSQNWNLFNYAYRYNFVYNNNQTITNVLFTDSVKKIGPDSIFYLNRVGVSCHGTCPTITTAITNTDIVIVPNMPQFLQRTLIKKANGDVLLQDTANLLIKPNCQLFENWIFDATNSKTAQCVSISTLTIFNLIDSVKMISINGIDTMIFSKKYGIIRFPGLYAKYKNYILVGLEYANSYDMNSVAGIKVPNDWDFYNFDVGDKFCENYNTIFVSGPSNTQNSNKLKNIVITGKSIQVGVGYTYSLSTIQQSRDFGCCPNYSGSNLTSTNSIITINCYSSTSESNKMYPSQVIKYFNTSFNFGNIVNFGLDNFGRFYKYFGLSCPTYSNVIIPNINAPTTWYNFGMILTPSPYSYENFSSVYGVGLGKIAEVLNMWGMKTEKCLSCAFKNGNLYFGNETNVSIYEEKILTDFLVYPNPVSSEFTIKNKLGKIARIKIINSVGQIIFIKNDVENEEEIQVNLSSKIDGIYFLLLYNQTNLAGVKKIIKN